MEETYKITHTLGTFGAQSNRDVPHILEKIFFSMDYTSLKTCMNVSKTWRKLLLTTPYLKRLEELWKELLKEKPVNEKKLCDASKEGDTEMVMKLCKNPVVDVNVVITLMGQHLNQSTPLIMAARGGHEEVIRVLLKAGAMVNKTAMLGPQYLPWLGLSPLHFAASFGHSNVVKLLLESGADPNQGSSALQLAAKKGHHDVCKVLLLGGARVQGLTLDEMTNGGTVSHFEDILNRVSL